MDPGHHKSLLWFYRPRPPLLGVQPPATPVLALKAVHPCSELTSRSILLFSEQQGPVLIPLRDSSFRGTWSPSSMQRVVWAPCGALLPWAAHGDTPTFGAMPSPPPTVAGGLHSAYPCLGPEIGHMTQWARTMMGPDVSRIQAESTEDPRWVSAQQAERKGCFFLSGHNL